MLEQRDVNCTIAAMSKDKKSEKLFNNKKQE